MDLRKLPAALPGAARCLPLAACFRASAPPAVSQHVQRQASSACCAPELRACHAACLRQHGRRRQPQRLTTAAHGGGSEPAEGQDWSRTAVSAGLFALWAGVLGYAFLQSPNQTPFRDQFFLEKLTGINPSSTVDVGRIFFNLFNIMGVYPAIYAALLLPAAKSRNNVPAGPFVALSFAAGMFALLPYFALWSPLPPEDRKLPPKSELGFVRKALESRITAGVLLAASIFLVGSAATAGGEEWANYFKLFDESRFVHVTSIDFLLLTTFVPFWIANDAEFRGKFEDTALFFGLVPVIGPALYLFLRPRSE